MFGTSTGNFRGFNGDNGTIRVGNESSIVPGGESGVDSGGSNSVFGKVSLFGSNNFGGLGGGNGTVSIGNETTSMSEGRVTIVSIVSVPCTSISMGISSDRGNNTLGSKVSSLSSEDLRGLGRGNSTTGVGDELNSRGSSHAGSEENL